MSRSPRFHPTKSRVFSGASLGTHSKSLASPIRKITSDATPTKGRKVGACDDIGRAEIKASLAPTREDASMEVVPIFHQWPSTQHTAVIVARPLTRPISSTPNRSRFKVPQSPAASRIDVTKVSEAWHGRGGQSIDTKISTIYTTIS